MGKYTDADSDAGRLPEGMKRVGYDADSGVYTYRDASDGSYWEGLPGAEYGRLYRQGQAPLVGEEQARAEEEVARQGNARSWRMLAPFLLLVCLVPVLMVRVVGGGGGAGAGAGSGAGKHLLECGEGMEKVVVEKGDSCWGVADMHGMSVEELLHMNEGRGIDCERLGVGTELCVRARGASGSTKEEGGSRV